MPTRKKGFNDARLCALKIRMEDINLGGIDGDKANELYRLYMQHRFDLLGSGWCKNSYESEPKGFQEYKYEVPKIEPDKDGLFLKSIINRSNVKSSIKVWKSLSDGYVPIDWQRDFISGYRWDNDRWYRPQLVADKLGGDIKVPWELGRMQHLPRLAWMYRFFPQRKNEIYIEFQDELIDFYATNPVRYGVNFVCTMDVGIRTANVVLAYSMLKSQGVTFSDEFEMLLYRFIYEHCNHIRNNLEWSKFLTSNHYFADIAGLLYGCSILPKNKKRDEWLYFAAEEINNEIIKQFHTEGSNGEGSTAYHRLTSEMALYSLALIINMNSNGESLRLDKEALNIVKRAGDFSSSILRPDGMFTQIGDNDSGLFFRLSITGELLSAERAIQKYYNLSNYVPDQTGELYLDENMNDAGPFLSAASGLFKYRYDFSRKYPLEESLVNMLVHNKIDVDEYEHELIVEEPVEIDLTYDNEFIIDYLDCNLLEGLHWNCYPQFGIYILSGEKIYLCVNATDNGQKGNGGHAHNDKLSFELFIEGKSFFEDAGTYVYTSFPEARNEFRSVKSHNTIYVGEEQNEFNGMFAMYSRSDCRLLGISDNEIELEVQYGDIVHRRRIVVEKERIVILDRCNKPFEPQFVQGTVSRGYGKVLNKDF